MNLSNKNHPVYEPEKWNKDVNIKQPTTVIPTHLI